MSGLVSIIIPIYNVEKYLIQGLKSLVNQTYKKLEIICVIDGSTDNSEKIVEEFSEIYTDYIWKIFVQENKGQATARNVGLSNATGEYIYFFDADDILDSNLIDECVKFMKKYPVELMRFWSHEFTTVPNFDDKKGYNKLPFITNIMTVDEYLLQSKFKVSAVVWSYFFKKSFLYNNKIEFAEGIKYEDMEYSAHFLIMATNIGYLDKNLYAYRNNPTSTMNTIRREKVELAVESYKILIFLLNDLLKNTKISDIKKAFLEDLKTHIFFILKSINALNHKEEQILIMENQILLPTKSRIKYLIKKTLNKY